MVGGRGWGNENFLDSLGGSDEDREDNLESYKEFHESRAEFLERQKKLSENPQVQKFMEARARAEMNEGGDDMMGGINMDEMMGINNEANIGSGGGARFRQMMGRKSTLKERFQQQQQQQQQQQGFYPDQFGMVNDEDD